MDVVAKKAVELCSKGRPIAKAPAAMPQTANMQQIFVFKCENGYIWSVERQPQPGLLLKRQTHHKSACCHAQTATTRQGYASRHDKQLIPKSGPALKPRSKVRPTAKTFVVMPQYLMVQTREVCVFKHRQQAFCTFKCFKAGFLGWVFMQTLQL